MAGFSVNQPVSIDFRPFINRMRYNGEQIEKSVNSVEVKEQILREVVGELIQPESTITGATQASIDAIKNGENIENVPYTDGQITRYAYSESEVLPNGDVAAYIDPVDAYGNHYGEYNVNADALNLSAYEIKNNKEVYDIIYDAVVNAIGK